MPGNAGTGTSIGVITLDLRILNSISEQINNIAAEAQRNAGKKFESVGDAASKAMQKPLEAAGASMEKAITAPVENAQKAVQATLKKTQDQVNATASKMQETVAGAQATAAAKLTVAIPAPAPANSGPAWKPQVDPTAFMANYGKSLDHAAAPDLSDTFLPATNAADLLQQKLVRLQMQFESEREKLAALNSEFSRVSVGSKAWDEMSAKITGAEQRLISLQATMNATQAKIDEPARKAAAAAEKAAAAQEAAAQKAAAAQEKAAQRAAAAAEKAAAREQAAQARAAAAAEASTKRSGASMGTLRTQANAMLSAATSTTKGVARVGVMGRAFSAGLMGSPAVAGPLAAAAVAFGVLRKSISLATVNSNQFKSSLNQVKANLQVAFTPIYQAILPALNSLMSWLAAATKQIAAFIAALFGKTYAQEVAATKKMQQNADAAKKAGSGSGSKSQGQLAGFDELNVIGQKDTSSTGGIDYDALNTKGTEAANGLADKFKAAFDKINVALAPTKTALAGLQTQLQRLGSFAWAGLKDFYSSFLVPVGKWVLGTGLPGFINAIKDGMANINWGNINGALHDLWLALTPFAINVGSGLLWFWQNVLVPLGSWTMNVVVPNFLKILADAIKIVNGIINDLKPLGQWLFDSFLKPLAEWTGGKIADILNGIHEALSKISNWITDHNEAVQNMAIVVASFMAAWAVVNLAQVITGIVSALVTFIATGGLATAVTTALGAAVAFLTSPVTLVILAIGALIAVVALLVTHWGEVQAAAAACWAAIQSVWNTVATWFMNSVVTPVKNFFTSMWTTIKSAAQTAWSGISGIWSVVSKWFNTNIILPVGKFFSDLWNGISGAAGTAWDMIAKVWITVSGWFHDKVIAPIESAFKNSINFLIGLVEGFVNAFIGGINGIIKTLDQIHIPDDFPIKQWAGVGIHIQPVSPISIPRLASGGVLEQPTLAMMGEYAGARNNPEIAAPQSTLRDTFMETMVPLLNEMEEFRADIVALLREIIAKNPNIEMDGVMLARLLKPYLDTENKRVGGSIF